MSGDRRPAGSPFEQELCHLLRSVLAEALEDLQVAAPLPRPIHVDVAGAAHLMSVSEDTVRGLIDRGELPTVDLGVHRIVIPVSAIEALPTKRAEKLRSVS